MGKPRAPRRSFVAETPRQDGAQGRVGRGPGDTLSNGEIDSSDPGNPPAPNSSHDSGVPRPRA
jgi:hypothetical protein